jgi:glycosyltransferase involved in cell wall biosynthesis
LLGPDFRDASVVERRLSLSPLVSVIVPAFNAESYIADAVGSVLKQTCRQLEVLIVDDGSTDGTAEIAERLAADSRVRVICQANAGVAHARNRALAICRAPHVAFLDADDVWHPEKLDRQLEVLNRSPSVIVVGCQMRYLGPNGQIIGHTGQATADIDRSAVAAGRLVPFLISSSIFRKEVLKAVDGFDESLDRDVPGQVEDLDLFARVAHLGDFALVPESLGSYRVHDLAASASKAGLQQISARFIRARLVAVQRGETLFFRDWFASYRPTFTQRRTDRAQVLYREAGRHALMGRRVAAFTKVAMAAVLSPTYVVRRLPRQLG